MTKSKNWKKNTKIQRRGKRKKKEKHAVRGIFIPKNPNNLQPIFSLVFSRFKEKMIGLRKKHLGQTTFPS